MPLYERIWESQMFEAWHWWQWNFELIRRVGNESPFAVVVRDALVRCDATITGLGSFW